MDLETLQDSPGAAPAQLDRLGAVSAATARQLACDAAISRVIARSPSQPLDVGRESRTAAPAQRRALAVRDGGCIGCRAPVAWCQAHHVIFWDRRGASQRQPSAGLRTRAGRSGGLRPRESGGQ